MNIAVKQLIVMVSDMERSVAFYRDALGLAPITVSEHWSEFRAGAATIALHPGRTGAEGGRENGTDAGTLTVTLAADDLASAVAALRAKGVDVDGPRLLEGTDTPIATFSDPDGLSFSMEPAN